MQSHIARRRTKKRFRVLLSASLAAYAIHGQFAIAQVAAPAPVRNNIDANGVDLFLGSLNVDGPALSAGDETQGLSWQKLIRGTGLWSDTLLGSLTVSGSTVYVSFGGYTSRFTQSGSTYTSTEADGATLTNSSGTWTFTAPDGTVAVMNASYAGAFPYGNAVGIVQTVTRPNGAKFTYTYGTVRYCAASKAGPSGQICTQYKNAYRISSVTSSGQYKLNFTYTGSLDSLADADGVPTTAQFQDWGNLVSVQLSNSAISGSAVRSQSFGGVYTGGTSYYKITDSLGGATFYRYNSASINRIVGIQYPGDAAESITIAYDSAGRVSSISNANGITGYSYSDNGNNRTVTVTDGTNHSTTYVFDIVKQRPTAITNAYGKTVSNEYDSSGRLTKSTQPEGNYIAYTLDSKGNATTTQMAPKADSGSAALTTTASYPCASSATCNKPQWTKDPLGNQTDYSYDSATGNVTKVTLPAATSGAARPTTTYTYSTVNSVSMLTGVTTCLTAASCSGTANEAKTSIGYNSNGLAVSVAKSAGDNSITSTTTLGYDDVGNLISVDGPLSGTGDTTVYVYDVMRRARGVMGPAHNSSSSTKNVAARVTYDAAGRVTLSEQGFTAGQTSAAWVGFTPAASVATEYDLVGRKTRDTLKSGVTAYSLTQYNYDAAGRLNCSTVRMDSTTFGSPPDACTLTAVTSAGPDRISKYGYDDAGRVTQITTAFNTAQQASETQNYTDNGQLSYIVDANLNRTSYEYDGHDRLVKTRYPETTKGSNSSSTTDYEQLTYGDNVHVTQRELRDRTAIAMSYDNLGRVTGISGATVPARTFSYNLLGMQTSATFTSGGQSVTNAFDAFGRVTSQATPQGAVSYQYDAASRRTRITWPDTFFVTYDYDAAGNVVAIRESGATSGIQVLASYSYDDRGRRSAVAYGNGTSRNYAYDAVDRLVGLKIDPSGTANDLIIGAVGGTGTAIVYNPASQITSITKSNDAYAWTGHYNFDRNYTTNGLNQYTASGSTSLGYDGRGNLTSSGGTTYTYNGLNQLTSVGGSNSATLSYDPGDRLYQLASGGVTTRYLYDGVNMVGEYDGTNALLRRFVPGPDTDEPIVWYEGSGTTSRRWLQGDERGSIATVLDASGAAIGINRYDEYGIPQTTNTGRFQYTGQVWLGEAGLYYYKARFYSPTLGRFMQTDPIGYGDGLNWYNYVGSDPVNLSDPDGRLAQEVPTINVFGNRGGNIETFYPPAGWSWPIGALPDSSEGDEIVVSATAPKKKPQAGRLTLSPCGRLWSLDSTIQSTVQSYNQSKGLKDGDAEYLDPTLVEAMVSVEAGHDTGAYRSDPMQVNNTGDWVPEKAGITGLSKGIAPGQALGIKAGVAWLTYKAYTRSTWNSPLVFKGWNRAVSKYNGGGDPGYLQKVLAAQVSIRKGC